MRRLPISIPKTTTVVQITHDVMPPLLHGETAQVSVVDGVTPIGVATVVGMGGVLAEVTNISLEPEIFT